MIDIEKCFEFHFNDIIVVGCSAGPDSMALMDMLLKIQSKYHLSLIVAHVNHNVREESLKESQYVKDYCQKNHLVFETMTIEEYGDDNFENEARTIRYQFFDSLVNKYYANYLMTAHHGDDLIETVMMRLVRGSNLNGYGGFKKVVSMGNYQIVRPLISFTKKELEEYDDLNHVKYYVDSSNADEKYTRNRYRKVILPFLKAEDQNVHLKFKKFSDLLEEAGFFIEKAKQEAIHRVWVNESININLFKKEEPFLQKEILYWMLGKFYQDDLLLLNDRHIDLILKLIYSNKANGFINLPNDVIAQKCYNMLELKRTTEDITSYEIEFDRYVTLPNSHTIELIEDTTDNSNYICRLNSKEISLPLIVRTRKIGDKMMVKGLNGTQKIKDIFIDKKIQKNERDSWPVVLDSAGQIVWIPGIKKSKFDKKSMESYDIILKYS